MVSCVLHLLLLLLLTLATATLGSLGLLSSDTAGAAATKGRGQREVNVLLGVQADHEGGHVDDLLADTDVALADEDTGMVDGLGETELVDTGLETTLQEVLDLQGQNVIELHAGLVEDTDTDETANQGVTFEETLGVLLVEGKKLTVAIIRCRLIPRLRLPCNQCNGKNEETYRAARRILDRVSWTRQTSRLFFRPYSPTSFSSESLRNGCQFGCTFDVSRVKLLLSGRAILTDERPRRVCEIRS